MLKEINPLNHKEVDSKGRVKSNLPRVTKDMMIALSQDNEKKK